MGVVNPQGRGPSSYRPSSFSPQTVAARVGIVATWVAVALSLFSALDIYPPLALIPIAFGIAAIVIQSALGQDRRPRLGAKVALILMLLLTALVPTLFQSASLPMVAAGAWALDAAYSIALAAGAWRQLSAFFKVAAVLFGLVIALFAATLTKDVVAGDEPSRDDRDPEWSVAVTVLGGHDQFDVATARPLANALVNCAVVDFAYREAVHPITLAMPRITDDEGKATFGFKGPRWIKAVVCEAERKADGETQAYSPGDTISWVPFFESHLEIEIHLGEEIKTAFKTPGSAGRWTSSRECILFACRPVTYMASMDMHKRLSELERLGEAYYEAMYHARNPTADYANAKDAFRDAIALAREFGETTTVERLQARLAHIKAVFRSQFS